MSKNQQPVNGVIHSYAFRKIAFEFSPEGHKPTDKVLIVIGGLMDGLLTVPYHPPLAEALSKHGWSVIQIEFTSSHSGWGTGSLVRDSKEIHQLVGYLKSIGKKEIGIMGHSTGCQNVMHYFSKSGNDDVDFGILQAPVSDRVSAGESLKEEEVAASLQLAKDLIASGKSKEIMPTQYTKHFFNVPINAYRWHSLIGVRGDDDFFSPDLTEADWATTFGKIDCPYLVLYSGSDEFVPSWLDKEELMKKWALAGKDHGWSKLSKVIKGAKHNLGEGSTEGAMQEGINTVVSFITAL